MFTRRLGGARGERVPRRLRLHAGRQVARRQRLALRLRRLVPHRPGRPERRLAVRRALGPPRAHRSEDRIQARALAPALHRRERRGALPRGVARERAGDARARSRSSSGCARCAGSTGDAELPVCDGCQCGACATMADGRRRGRRAGTRRCTSTRAGASWRPAEEPRDRRREREGRGRTASWSST